LVLAEAEGQHELAADDKAVLGAGVAHEGAELDEEPPGWSVIRKNSTRTFGTWPSRSQVTPESSVITSQSSGPTIVPTRRTWSGVT
jgi:hypothetical protein